MFSEIHFKPFIDYLYTSNQYISETTMKEKIIEEEKEIKEKI